MSFKFIDYAPVLFISALSGQGVAEVMPLAYQIYSERMKRLSEAEVSSVVKQALASHPPPRRGTRQLVIKKGSQTAINPPTFTFRVNDARLVHFSYRRYLENQLRQAFSFTGTPINLVFSAGGES
jgi:GTP-binding protein